MTSPIDIEMSLFERGFYYVVGVDEAGRGAIAGDVYVGYAVLPIVDILAKNHTRIAFADLRLAFKGVKDSKLFVGVDAHSDRKAVLERVRSKLISGGTTFSTSQHIDEVGIDDAINHCVESALHKARSDIAIYAEVGYPEPNEDNIYFLCDQGLYRPHFGNGQNLIRGDKKSLSIAMASLFAKTERDDAMMILDARYPEYGFAAHKGYYAYGTTHIDDIKRLGLIPPYRRSYNPVKTWLQDGVMKDG